MKFSKRIVSPLRTGEGKVMNRAAGHNDVGSLIKAQFDPGMRSLTANNSFADVHGDDASDNKPSGKRINQSIRLNGGVK